MERIAQTERRPARAGKVRRLRDAALFAAVRGFAYGAATAGGAAAITLISWWIDR
ncbi:hypothetical protein [Actinomadura citrea]|uniref:Uncharacterized protein n=1 Tax=Actinomadura citrea TaxID=46158 RepID=A0A7Y9KED2_9ACTN|nr:hypothetical protein [Actinomadura citrea]NYE16102.1 hypothetical protein [Actinomadura citrea]GGT81127.1 hypothetical protein GCM10010177_45260 [Actinomadura citrea]